MSHMCVCRVGQGECGNSVNATGFSDKQKRTFGAQNNLMHCLEYLKLLFLAAENCAAKFPCVGVFCPTFKSKDMSGRASWV